MVSTPEFEPQPHWWEASAFTTAEAAWPSGQRVGLAIRRSRVRVPLWPLAGFALGRPEFKFSATLVNSQLVAFCQLGFLILLCLYLNYLFPNI